MLLQSLLEISETTGPEVRMKFEICKGGRPIWVGWILGARAVDCEVKGGVGLIPMDHGHHFAALGVNCGRTVRPGGLNLDSYFAFISSVLDSASGREDTPLAIFYQRRFAQSAGAIMPERTGNHTRTSKIERRWHRAPV